MAFFYKGLSFELEPIPDGMLKHKGLSFELELIPKKFHHKGLIFELGQPEDLGETCKLDVVAISSVTGSTGLNLPLEEFKASECCFNLPVFADITTDPFKNDITAVREGFGDSFESVVMVLEKDGSDVAELSDNAYGNLFEYGFHEFNSIKYVGYLIEWQKVLSLGSGCYRVRFEATDLFGNTTFLYSFSYDLKPYSPILAHDTVRLEYLQSDSFGSYANPSKLINLSGIDWRNQIRLPGAMFGRHKTTFEIEQFRQNNQVRLDIENKQERVYKLAVNGLPWYIHHFLEAEVLTADTILLTDYNNDNNYGKFINFEVKHQGDYEPQNEGNPVLSSVEIEFILRQNNLRKFF